jgi:hypothetical protein
MENFPLVQDVQCSDHLNKNSPDSLLIEELIAFLVF